MVAAKSTGNYAGWCIAQMKNVGKYHLWKQKKKHGIAKYVGGIISMLWKKESYFIK